MYDGVGSSGDSFFWIFVGQAQQIVIVDDLDNAWSSTGTWTTTSAQTAPYQNYIQNPANTNGAGSVKYAASPSANPTASPCAASRPA